MIKQLIIKNFKGIKEANIKFNSGKNVIVGNNGAGKSTIVEALSLALGYGLSKLEITPYLFHKSCVEDFRAAKNLPEISIEVVMYGERDEFSGTNNSLHQLLRGLRLKICFDDEAYSDLFEKEKETCTQIPCEYYKVERYWFSDASVKQLLIPYNVLLVDSASSYFNSSSNQYVASLVKRYIGDEDLVKVQTGLRMLRQKFDGSESVKDVNEKIKQEIEELSLSIDVTSNIVMRNILCPFLDEIPVEQIGAGELCMLKTMLSIDKGHSTDKQKIIIVEEPESHLSHTKMYELIGKIEENIKDTNTQLIITTHNNFIANKLDLENLILVDNNEGVIKTQTITEDSSKEMLKFFTKISNYPTLRIVLCKAAILVEGPTDEMVVTYYYKKKYSHFLFDDGIELISVEGVGFKRYVELGKAFDKKITIITDNDGKAEADVIKARGVEEMLTDKIKLFTEKDTSLNTLEPSFVNKNADKTKEMSKTFRKREKKDETEESLRDFMISNKTEWAYRLLDGMETIDFDVPNYIKDAIGWIRNNAEQ